MIVKTCGILSVNVRGIYDVLPQFQLPAS